ncbi:MAG: hypothetical protein U0T83_01425 [Bacteriovoracaceae bacterium]
MKTTLLSLLTILVINSTFANRIPIPGPINRPIPVPVPVPPSNPPVIISPSTPETAQPIVL